MASSIELKTTSGRPVERVFVELRSALEPNESDLALAGQLVRADIREKTARGVDVDGSPFAPYADDRPYYYNPAGRGAKFDARSKSSASRLKRALAKHGREGELSRTGTSVKFDSYKAFKEAFGRPNVDLQGPSSPHMLDAMVVMVNGRRVEASDRFESITIGDATISRVDPPAREVVVGIYDPRAAAIASGHNDGLHKHLPRRRFFGVSTDAAERVRRLLLRRLRDRARRALEG